MHDTPLTTFNGYAIGNDWVSNSFFYGSAPLVIANEVRQSGVVGDETLDHQQCIEPYSIDAFSFKGHGSFHPSL